MPTDAHKTEHSDDGRTHSPVLPECQRPRIRPGPLDCLRDVLLTWPPLPQAHSEILMVWISNSTSIDNGIGESVIPTTPGTSPAHFLRGHRPVKPNAVELRDTLGKPGGNFTFIRHSASFSDTAEKWRANDRRPRTSHALTLPVASWPKSWASGRSPLIA
jgi:hypothetical protein